jgi:hypothetical protein
VCWGGDEKFVQHFVWNSKNYQRKIGYEGVGWIHLAWDMDQWWAVLNIVMNIQVS